MGKRPTQLIAITPIHHLDPDEGQDDGQCLYEKPQVGHETRQNEAQGPQSVNVQDITCVQNKHVVGQLNLSAH